MPFQKGNQLGKLNIGRQFTEEHKKKLSEAKIKNPTRYWLGKKRSEATKRKVSEGHVGKKHSEKTRIKMSQSHSGDKNHNWKSGITPVNIIIRQGLTYRLWRESVFKRDNYICQLCGQRGGILNADHIKPFALFIKLRFSLDNGRTLCLNCHRKTDTYGWKSYNYYEKQ